MIAISVDGNNLMEKENSVIKELEELIIPSKSQNRYEASAELEMLDFNKSMTRSITSPTGKASKGQRYTGK